MARPKKEEVSQDGAPPEKLLEWLRGCETVGCIRIEARHLIAGSEGGSVVCTWDIAETPDGGERFDAPNLWRRLEDDAEGIGSVQRYTLLAFRDGSKAPRERLTIRVDGGADGDPSVSEPANAHGLVAQAHRHNEAMMRMLAQGYGQTMATLVEENKRLSSALSSVTEQAEKDRVELWSVLREVSTFEKEREHAKHSLQLKEKQADVMRDGIKLLLPALVTKVTQAMGMPATPAVTDQNLARLVESLTEEQQAAVFSLLTPEQAIALGTFLDTFMKKGETPKEKSDGKA
jgi:hypothetical protein